jgi:prevent-host-death family protein
MSEDQYSTYEAKARFSELLRKVRRGRSVTITYHGEPVAELRPVHGRGSIEARVDRLSERGLVTPRPDRDGDLAPIATRPGALERFLEERDAP